MVVPIFNKPIVGFSIPKVFRKYIVDISANWSKLIGLQFVLAPQSISNKFKEFYGKGPEEISDRLVIKNATETIEMEDIPTMAIKHKKDSFTALYAPLIVASGALSPPIASNNIFIWVPLN